MGIVNLIIQLVCGLITGNATGSAMKERSLGTVGNSITGLVGGGLGGVVVMLIEKYLIPGGTAGLDFSNIIGSILGGGIGGSVLTAIVGFIKGAIDKNKPPK